MEQEVLDQEGWDVIPAIEQCTRITLDMMSFNMRLKDGNLTRVKGWGISHVKMKYSESPLEGTGAQARRLQRWSGYTSSRKVLLDGSFSGAYRRAYIPSNWAESLNGP